ncbi:phytoene desaturase family protein [Tundrisphaera lichenicola]|uniref:phytoene desaturase family protein n=1 Tax=Tundrisphaera lichenicola TaxID=2029860 RepID=UPI003EB6B100
MTTTRAVVIGGGLGGLAAALELKRRGYQTIVLERHAELGGKASERKEGGYRWDEGPSIVVMPWVYRTLFEASGLDPEKYLPLRRLDPAFRIVLSDGRTLDIPADQAGLRDAFAAIDPEEGPALDRFLEKMDRFAKLISHAYCDRILENWGQVMFSPLMLSAALISPAKGYAQEIDEQFRSPAIRELLYGFPTYSGFDPQHAPASLAIIPWTIMREGVWYPASGGIAAIPRSIASACRDSGVDIHTGVEVDAIELDSRGRVSGVLTSSGPIPTDVVVSNADYIQTFRMLRGGNGFSGEVKDLREGKAEPSTSFFTIQMACDRNWDALAHHILVLTKGSNRVYDELFVRGEYTSDPPIYANVTSVTDPDDAPAGGSNPFIVVGAPPLKPGREEERDRGFEERYADRLIDRLEQAGVPGLASATVSRKIAAPHDWRDRFSAFLGSIYGLGNKHNVLGGSFRPLNYRADVPGLYFVGGGVQPGAGMPMVVQSGKITAERIAREWPLPASKARPVAAR